MRERINSHFFEKWPLLFLLLLLTSCNDGMTIPKIGNPSKTVGPSVLASSRISEPTFTSTVSHTPTITASPTITPTPTPPPDLEIVNFTLNTLDVHWNLLGEIRNNTSEPMIFFAKDTAFNFFIDFLGNSTHAILGPLGFTPGDASNRDMNCILYPGETGVISTYLHENSDIPIISTEPAPDATDPVIKLLRYQGLYKRWENMKNNFPPSWTPLYQGYHPSVEKLSYELRGDNEIEVRFDLNITIPYERALYYFGSWIILYDQNDNIINILQGKLILTTDTPLVSDLYHIDGIGRESGCYPTSRENQCWQSKTSISSESLKALNHIRVVTEIENGEICDIGYMA